MRTGPVSWPPPWPGGDEPGAPPSARVGFPPASWPSRGQLDYVRALITALLLILALPWLAWTLVTRPGYVLRGAAQRQLKPT